MTVPQTAAIYSQDTHQLLCQGEWNLSHLPMLQTTLKQLSSELGSDCTVMINGDTITQMDSAGAWLLNDWENQLKQKNITLQLEKFSTVHQTLLSIIKKRMAEEVPLPLVQNPSRLAQMGQYASQQLDACRDYLAFIGELALQALSIAYHPKRWRLISLASVIYRNGYQALPIIALLSFMIGVVITYQLGLQLRSYGANLYIVDLLGLAVLREFGPLLTAIMVAGRTGSAFTAQLGMMKINQEIDALNTLGVTPAELLLLPRIIGLFIALPLLTLWADIFGVLGGMIMANNMLNITWYDFLHRFPRVIPLRALLIGLGKAPIFALIIASVGCHQGMRVEYNADSVGRNTTKSVVLAIFFIIVADAIFSIIFSKLKL